MRPFKSTKLDVVKKVFDIALAGFCAAYPEEAAAIRGINTSSKIMPTETAALLKFRQYMKEQMADTYEACTLPFNVPKYAIYLVNIMYYLSNPTKMYTQRFGAYWFVTDPLYPTEAGIYVLGSKRLVKFELDKAEHNSYNLSIAYAADCPRKLRNICDNIFQAYKEGCLDSFRYSASLLFFNNLFNCDVTDEKWQKIYSYTNSKLAIWSDNNTVLTEIVNKFRVFFWEEE